MLNIVKERMLAMERSILAIEAIAATGECQLAQQITRLAHAAAGQCPNIHIEWLAELEMIIGHVKAQGGPDIEAIIEQREANLSPVRDMPREQDYLLDLKLAFREVVEGKAESKQDFLVIVLSALRRAIYAEAVLEHLTEIAHLQLRNKTAAGHTEEAAEKQADAETSEGPKPEHPGKLNRKVNPVPKEGLGDTFKKLLDEQP